GELSNRELEKVLNMHPSAKALVEKATDKLKLSARSYYKLLKVCRTIADLEGEEEIKPLHVSEAVMYVREPLEVV
ncbi:MAG: hypothetical protein DSZ30_04010, partial [Aquificaceae bacterium]